MNSKLIMRTFMYSMALSVSLLGCGDDAKAPVKRDKLDGMLDAELSVSQADTNKAGTIQSVSGSLFVAPGIVTGSHLVYGTFDVQHSNTCSTHTTAAMCATEVGCNFAGATGMQTCGQQVRYNIAIRTDGDQFRCAIDPVKLDMAGKVIPWNGSTSTWVPGDITVDGNGFDLDGFALPVPDGAMDDASLHVDFGAGYVTHLRLDLK